MTYVPLCLISWDWFTDFRGIVVGVVSGAIGGALAMRLWDAFVWRRDLGGRMNNIESGFEKLDTSLSAKILALDGTISGRLIAVDARIGTLPTAMDAMKIVSDAHYESLSNAIEQLHNDVKKHFVDCNEHIIGPMKKQIEKLSVPA
jgi:hypothetical protein